MSLNFRQKLFVSYYLGEAAGNATRSARMAGYRHPNKIGPRLLVKVGIRRAIDEHVADVAMTAKEVLARLSLLASADVEDILEFDADAGPEAQPRINLRKARRLRRLGCVKKVRQSDGETEVDLHDPLRPLTLLAKYHGLIDGLGEADDDGTMDPEAARAAQAAAAARKP